MLRPGSMIGDRYRLDRVIGSGGMGVVFAATHMGLRRSVAVKILRRGEMDAPAAAARMLREARAVSTLRSEHVAQVLDVGTYDGGPFLVMELLEGCTLHDLVRGEVRMAAERAVDLTIQACHALNDAHARGIVHRDIKPSNLFMAGAEPNARLKVIDFGILKSKPLEADQTDTKTKTGTLLGSPSFMSPEQIRSSSDVDGRSDLWSLGVVLYYMLAGKKPFEGESLLDLMTLIVHQPAPPLRNVRTDLPEGLENIVLRCLEKDRDRRFPTAAELALALAPFASTNMRVLAESFPTHFGPVLQWDQEISSDAEGDASLTPSMPMESPALPADASIALMPTHTDDSSRLTSSRAWSSRAFGMAAVVALLAVLTAAVVGTLRKSPGPAAVVTLGAPSEPALTPHREETTTSKPAPLASPSAAQAQPVAATVGRSSPSAAAPSTPPKGRSRPHATVAQPAPAAISTTPTAKPTVTPRPKDPAPARPELPSTPD